MAATQKNQDIQLLRGVAIVLVMMQHYRGRMPTPSAYSELFSHVTFWPGVDIFFAISGFLICRSFLRDLTVSQGGGEAFASFWRRRAARLLPASVFWCLASIAAAAVVTTWPGADPLAVARSAIFGILGISNLYWASCVQQVFHCGSADFNGVTWSLALEWQLYALITLLIWAVGVRKALLLMVAISVAASLIAAPSFSLIWVLRPQSFTLGALIFLCTKDHYLDNMKLFPILAPVAFAAAIIICISAPVHLSEPLVLPVVSMGAALCLFCSMGGNVLTSWPPSSYLVWIGEKSYSIYLCHLPVFLLTRELLARTVGIDPTPLSVVGGLVIALGGTALCGHLSYKYIEAPFQRMGRTLARRRSAAIP